MYAWDIVRKLQHFILLMLDNGGGRGEGEGFSVGFAQSNLLRGSRLEKRDCLSHLPLSRGHFVVRWCWCEVSLEDCCNWASETYLMVDRDGQM